MDHAVAHGALVNLWERGSSGKNPTCANGLPGTHNHRNLVGLRLGTKDQAGEQVAD
jgi:hypothetical protein